MTSEMKTAYWTGIGIGIICGIGLSILLSAL